MRTPVTVRRAQPGDGPAFLALVRALAEFEDLPPPTEAACSRLLRDAFADPPSFELWVAELPDWSAERTGPADEPPDEPPGALKVAAYAVTFMTYSTFLARPTLYLEDIFVHPDARRRGVASAVMKHLLDLARTRGCGRCEWMVLDWNEGAKELYRQLGAHLHTDWQLNRVTFSHPET